MSTCDQVTEDLAQILDGDRDTIARHADHLATCDACRDARHEASNAAALLADAGSDHAPAGELVAKLLAAVDRETKPAAPAPVEVALPPAKRKESRPWLMVGAAAALAASGTAVLMMREHGTTTDPKTTVASATDAIGKLAKVTRAAADHADGIAVQIGNGTWRPLRAGDSLPAGARLHTDERTRAAIDLADGTKLVLDHRTSIAFDPAEPRRIRLEAGRLVADVAHVEGRPASVATPNGEIAVVGTRFSATVTDTLTSVQVVRGSVVLTSTRGDHDEVRAGEEGSIDNGKLSVGAAPGLAHEVSWSELGAPAAKPDEASSGLGALRAYKPGETRDRDWNLALAKHDVKVRISGPIARTEVTETFRNDSDAQLEGVYQFPLPVDAQIDGLSLDVDGKLLEGAFVDKTRAAKIWKGVIDRAKPIEQRNPLQEIVWVPGPWRDPALLDWKRGGRFELRIFPIPAKGARTIKIAYTQVVTPHGAQRQYVYPLPHSADGSTVADSFTADVEVRGAVPGAVRAAGYDLAPDPARADVNALTLSQGGFVPRGDLVIDYRATDGDAELRAWTFTGGVAAAPDDKLAAKHNVGIDPAVVAAQKAVAADVRPTAVLALRPKLPRWRESKARDYVIVVDGSQSMVGERYTRATELATAMVEEMDRRDRFTALVCDSECRRFGDPRTPANAGSEIRTWLAAQTPAGASDVVAAIRAAGTELRDGNRERWILYVGDGFASTGFRRASDVERAIADSTTLGDLHVSTIGIGSDADATLLAAAARGGGGSFLAWVPGESVGTAALATLESTYGATLRDATVELPAGLADVAPAVLPTVRTGEEVLLAARITGDVSGDVIVRGRVAGQPFEQRYPLKLAVSSSPGNGFVPRLWASLAIEQLERKGLGEDHPRLVALSQGYGVMSRETSLLVLESQAMFDAFGVDRNRPAVTWTGEEQLDEVASVGKLDVAQGDANVATSTPAPAAPAQAKPEPAKKADDGLFRANGHGSTGMSRGMDAGGGADSIGIGPAINDAGFGRARNMVAMRRVWERVAAVSNYDGVNPSIRKAIADSEDALAKSPDSREKHRALVQALSYAGELDRARDIASKWLDRDRLDPQALGYIADLLGRDGKRDLALRTLAGLVDLDADRVALHERMITAYERTGRLAQACAHRIALSTLQARDAKVAGAAARCLRSVGHDRDADLVLRGLPDDATRAAAEKAATVAAPEPRIAGDLVIDAKWQGTADLDVSLIAPDGTRVSWMGGRSDVAVASSTSHDHEDLAVRTLRRGNYLVEISRGDESTTPIRGTLDMTALGVKRSVPFELTGTHVTAGRISVTLQDHLEPFEDGLGSLQPITASVSFGGALPDDVNRVIRSRAGVFRACYQRELNRNPSIAGRLVVQFVIDEAGAPLAAQIGTSSLHDPSLEDCVVRQFSRLHFPARDRPITINSVLAFTPSS